MGSFSALNAKARKEFYKKLIEYFDLESDFSLDGLLFVTNKNKYYLVDNKFSDVAQLKLRIVSIGLYIAEINPYGEIRISLEGSSLIGPYAKKHILTLPEELVMRLMKGEDVSYEDIPQQYYIISSIIDNKALYFGSCKYKNGYLLNFIPKSRRIHE